MHLRRTAGGAAAGDSAAGDRPLRALLRRLDPDVVDTDRAAVPPLPEAEGEVERGAVRPHRVLGRGNDRDCGERSLCLVLPRTGDAEHIALRADRLHASAEAVARSRDQVSRAGRDRVGVPAVRDRADLLGCRHNDVRPDRQDHGPRGRSQSRRIWGWCSWW